MLFAMITVLIRMRLGVQVREGTERHFELIRRCSRRIILFKLKVIVCLHLYHMSSIVNSRKPVFHVLHSRPPTFTEHGKPIPPFPNITREPSKNANHHSPNAYGNIGPQVSTCRLANTNTCSLLSPNIAPIDINRPSSHFLCNNGTVSALAATYNGQTRL